MRRKRTTSWIIEARLRRPLGAGGIVAVGGVTAVVHLYHLATEQGDYAVVLGALVPLALSILLASMGVWLYRSEFDDANTLRVTGWTGIGLFAGAAFGYPTVLYQAAHGVAMIDVPFVVVAWMTTGALGGFLVGFYDARHRQYRAALETERAELAARREELERQNERLDRFVSTVSHDLRNPLNVATARLEFLQDEYDSEHLAAASRALERMGTLIDDLLALARQGEPIDDTERVTLATAANRAWRVVETGEATMTVDGELAFVADPERLQQLLENLIRNAIEHGGEAVTIRVGPLPEQPGFYVADDGPGIPEDERDAVFESGYSTAEEGTGFGLAIVSEIADAHGWEIGLTASKDDGARFEIRGVEGEG